MDGKVIPDEVLENTSCHVCCKYLTVTPIQSIDGCITICGRCDPQRSAKVILRVHGDFSAHRPFEDLPLSLLGFLTNPSSLYPCINRLDGCEQLLQLEHVREHETRCFYQKTECPRCLFGGVGSQLFQHFKREHRQFVLTGWKTFRVDLRSSFRESYLFRKNNLVCLLEMSYSEQFGQCLLRTSCVTKGDRRAKIKLSLSDVYEFIVVSKEVEICDRKDYIISFKIDDVHLKETPFIICKYDVILFN